MSAAMKAWQVDHAAFVPIGPNDSVKSMMQLEIEMYPIGADLPLWFAFKVGEHVTILSEESATEMMEWLRARVAPPAAAPAPPLVTFTEEKT